MFKKYATIAESTFLEHIEELGKDFVERLKQEVEDQGHRATGGLINSIENVVTKKLNQITQDILHAEHGRPQNTGVGPGRIAYYPGSGKKTSKFIQALSAWVRLKKLTSGLDKDVMRATFAIANKMKKTGMPTPNSYRFSRNGRRKGWLTHTIKIFKPQIELRIDTGVEEYIDKLLEAIVDNFIDTYGANYIVKI